MTIRGIRGAITVEKNTHEEILSASRLLVQTILEKNELNADALISITFTATRDLDAVYPARAVRDMGYINIPLMCMQEMQVKGSLAKCIRILILCETEKCKTEIVHVYLREARSLRPDWVKEE